MQRSFPRASRQFSLPLSMLVRAALPVVATVAAVVPAGVSHAAGSSVISGSAYDDANRNGVRDPGEAPFSGRQINVFDASGAYVTNAVTDTNGNYVISGLADGTYTVAWDTTDYQSLRQDWVPTTTGSLRFSETVSLSGAATANFGLRQIVRSTDISAPLSTYTASSGLVVRSYNDAVSAASIYTTLAGGSLVGGPEAATTQIYFDYGTQTDCSASVGGSAGSYTGFSASLWIGWLPWLDSGERTLFHEYGHAWSLYNDWIVQQESDLASYLAARGLTGDSRIGSSSLWDPREMIAEDYRQLFGTPVAAAYPQANTDIPPAAQVPGLKDWLQNTFTKPPSSSSGGTSTSGSTTTQPTPLTVSAPTVTPTPVSTSGTVTAGVSTAATVTIEIRTSTGTLVRTLMNAVASPAGSVSASWDRKDAKGRRVKSGTYVAAVTATDGTGTTAAAKTSFQVS